MRKRFKPLITLPLLILVAFSSSTFPIAPASAAATLYFSNSNGVFNAWNQGANDIYLNKITATPGVVIASIRSGFASNVATQSSSNTVYLFTDVSGAPGSVAATFTYSSNDGVNWATYTGSYTVPAGGTFFIGQRSSVGINNAGGATTNQAGTSWSITYSSRYSGNSLTGPFTSSTVGSSPIWEIYGVASTTLATPAAPVLSATSSSISVSETSTNVNASNYLVKLFQSNGSTLIESKTVSSATILSGTVFSGLSPNTQYKVGVSALGDGSTYSDSAMSSLSSITTNLGTTSLSLSIVGNPSLLTYRSNYQIRASVIASTGFVTFKVNGKVISSCQKVVPTSSTSTCNWKPALHGLQTITAAFTSTNASYTSSIATPLTISAERRNTKR